MGGAVARHDRKQTDAPLDWVSWLRRFADDISSAFTIIKLLLLEIGAFVGFLYLLYRSHFWSP
jgi:hypothetical protein